tara:strand:+ start:386 stop:700 length:315 start_codon:yes stop_codon:yes gene_type:complete
MNKVFWTSVISLATLLVIGVVMAVIDLTVGIKEVPTWVSAIAAISAWLWGLSVLILWMSGFIKFFRYQNERTSAVNLALFFFLLLGNIFAAYYFHFRKENSLSS